MTTTGHNSGAESGQLRAFVDRLEKLNEERAAIVRDISDVYKEVASAGFDKPAVRQVIKRRAADPDKRANIEAMVELYETQLEGK